MKKIFSIMMFISMGFAADDDLKVSDEIISRASSEQYNVITFSVANSGAAEEINSVMEVDAARDLDKPKAFYFYWTILTRGVFREHLSECKSSVLIAACKNGSLYNRDHQSDAYDALVEKCRSNGDVTMMEHAIILKLSHEIRKRISFSIMVESLKNTNEIEDKVLEMKTEKAVFDALLKNDKAREIFLKYQPKK